MNRNGIGTVGIFSLLALVFPFTLFAEVRTLQEFGAVGRTWSETVENTAEPDGGRSLKIQDPTETRVARYDVAGKLRSLAISGGRETFQAARTANKVAVTSPRQKLTVDLGSRDWIDSPEQAAKALLASGQTKAEFVYIPPNQPEMNLVLEIVNRGTVQRKDVTAIEFAISATGLMSLFVPPMTVWLRPDGRLVAQEVLPSPPGPTKGTAEERNKPQGGLKTVLQEVLGSQS